MAELDIAFKRRGEVTDVFLYDTPTLRYMPPVYYWLARSQQAMGIADARKTYERFVHAVRRRYIRSPRHGRAHASRHTVLMGQHRTGRSSNRLLDYPITRLSNPAQRRPKPSR
jgi:hypothetical protein